MSPFLSDLSVIAGALACFCVAAYLEGLFEKRRLRRKAAAKAVTTRIN